MEIAFAIEPGPQQRARLDSLRGVANHYFPDPKYHVSFDEFRPSFLTVILRITVIPDPPYGPGARIIFRERPLWVDWPDKPN